MAHLKKVLRSRVMKRDSLVFSMSNFRRYVLLTSNSMYSFRRCFDFDQQYIETFDFKYSTYCRSNFLRIAFSVIDVCDHFFT